MEEVVTGIYPGMDTGLYAFIGAQRERAQVEAELNAYKKSVAAEQKASAKKQKNSQEAQKDAQKIRNELLKDIFDLSPKELENYKQWLASYEASIGEEEEGLTDKQKKTREMKTLDKVAKGAHGNAKADKRTRTAGIVSLAGGTVSAASGVAELVSVPIMSHVLGTVLGVTFTVASALTGVGLVTSGVGLVFTAISALKAKNAYVADTADAKEKDRAFYLNLKEVLADVEAFEKKIDSSQEEIAAQRQNLSKRAYKKWLKETFVPSVREGIEEDKTNKTEQGGEPDEESEV